MREFASDMRCCCCGNRALVDAHLPAQWPGVSSDSRPWPRAGTLAACANCGHVQKLPTDAWLADIGRIYANYEIYHLSAGAEHSLFDAAGIVSKSARMLTRLTEAVPLPERGTLIDIGCGNGSLLRSFNAIRPRWELHGSEQSKRCESAVRGVPGVTGFHSGPIVELPTGFDCIVLMNVLEHFLDPVTALTELRPKLATGGLLVVQVPNLLENPFDLLVTDHRSHFTPQTLLKLARIAGYQSVVQATDWVAKEISLVLKAGSAEEIKSELGPLSAQPATLAVDWLNRVAHTARAAVERLGAENFGIFGTANAGTWLAALLGRNFGFFVDEDPTKWGKTHCARPILPPDQVPSAACVYLAFPQAVAESRAARLRARYPGLALSLPS